MSRSTDLAAIGGERVDRAARSAERVLRAAADARVALGLLLLAGLANAIAAALPGGSALLASPVYLVLLAAILCAGVASVAVRAPAAWREWRRPAPFADGPDVTVRPGDGTLRLLLRGERFDRPDGEMAALRRRLDDALRTAP